MYGLVKVASDNQGFWDEWLEEHPSLTTGLPAAAGQTLLSRKLKRPADGAIPNGLNTSSFGSTLTPDEES